MDRDGLRFGEGGEVGFVLCAEGVFGEVRGFDAGEFEKAAVELGLGRSTGGKWERPETVIAWSRTEDQYDELSQDVWNRACLCE